LFADFVYGYERVEDFYPGAPNNIENLQNASHFDFDDARRAAVVEAITPLNEGSHSLRKLAQPGTVAIITGQQVGLYGGPAYTIYKALTAVRIARELTEHGTPAVPMFWLATEDHDFAEVDHTFVFGAGRQPVKLSVSPAKAADGQPAGEVIIGALPVNELRTALAGLPFVEEACALAEAAYQPGRTMGQAFAHLMRELLGRFGMLFIDPMAPGLRTIAAPLMRDVVERMPELADAVIERSRELTSRGYHAQVLVDDKTSLVFLLDKGRRLVQKRSTAAALADRAESLSPNALLRPVVQDYLFPTAAYVGGAAEIAYFAQSNVLYEKLLGRQSMPIPRAGFTLLDRHAAHRVEKYRLAPSDLFQRPDFLRETIANRLVPPALTQKIERTRETFVQALDSLDSDLRAFDPSLSMALAKSRRKIEYQVGKIAARSARQLLAKDEQATRDATLLSGLIFPNSHLQERLYSFLPFYAQFGPTLLDEIFSCVHVECPDHQWAVL
jgi:bacillithiol biosynthesis cysteine-adding enzyme BshC